MHRFMSSFELNWTKAQEKANQNLQRAIELYKVLISADFNPNIDSWLNLYTAKIQLAELYKKTHRFSQGRLILEQIIKEVNRRNIGERLNRKNIQRIYYSAKHSLATLELEFCRQASIKQDYESYRSVINKSYKYLKQALELVIERIDDFLEEGEEVGQWQIQQFLKVKNSCVELIYQEADEFQEKEHFQYILNVVKKAERFLQHAYNKKGEIYLYNCYFYQAIALRSIGKDQEAIEMLQKDLEFEKRNHENESARKTKKQLLRCCLDHNKMQEAKKYCQNTEQKEILPKIQQRRNKMVMFFNQPPQILKKCKRTDYQSLFQDFDQEYNQYQFDNKIIREGIEKVIQIYKNQLAVRGLLYYYLAESNYRLGEYLKAEKAISEALKISCFDDYELRDWKIEQFQIKTKLCKDRGLIERRYNSLIQEIVGKRRVEQDKESINCLQNQKQNLIKCYKKYEKFERKQKESIFYSFQSASESKLLQNIENNNKNRRQKNSKYSQRRDTSIMSYRQPIHEERTKIAVFNPQADYIKKCKQFGIPIRQEMRRNANSIGYNPYAATFNLYKEELLSMLPLTHVQNLDLRNHGVDDEVLHAILSSDQNCLRKFKINGVNQLSLSLLLEVIGKMGSLSYLSFINFPSNKQTVSQMLEKNRLRNQQMQDERADPQSLTHLLLLLKHINSHLNPNRIRVLKLKYCNLFDENFCEIDFTHFQCLTQVSFSHNFLEGFELRQMMSLKYLNCINLSNNPLKTLSLEKWKGRFLDSQFTIGQLKLKDIDLTFELGLELSHVLQRTKNIQISKSRSLNYLVDQLWQHYIEGVLGLQIQRWIMKQVNIEFAIDRLISILSYSPALQLADFRFCKWSTVEQRQFIKQLHNVVIKADRQEMNPQISSFHLPFFTNNDFE